MDINLAPRRRVEGHDAPADPELASRRADIDEAVPNRRRRRPPFSLVVGRIILFVRGGASGKGTREAREVRTECNGPA
jgi:hypothetical protein